MRSNKNYDIPLHMLNIVMLNLTADNKPHHTCTVMTHQQILAGASHTNK